MSLLDSAMSYAGSAHAHQKRKDHLTPYIIHPLEVMRRLVRWGIKEDTILVAALLHDTLEDDTKTTFERLHAEFGATVAEWVRDLTFVSSQQDRTLRHKEKEQHLSSFGSKQIEVLVIKLADRLTNIDDFAAVDVGSALNYSKAAVGLFKTVQMRYGEIKTRFSQNVFLSLANDMRQVIYKYHINL